MTNDKQGFRALSYGKASRSKSSADRFCRYLAWFEVGPLELRISKGCKGLGFKIKVP